MHWIAPTPDPDADRITRFPTVPKHIAIIMDGNGRWAKQRGQQRIAGHWEGANRVDDITTECAKLGVSYLTLYAFSTENWNRPAAEISMLMQILIHYLKTMEKKLVQNRIRLIAQGSVERLPLNARKQLDRTQEKTADYAPRMYLNLSLSYGSRQELLDATKQIARKYADGELSLDSLGENDLKNYFYQPHVPDPELLIRSGGESRLSNFLLWQAAYAEFFVTETLWPDFREASLHEAINYYTGRERRFGKTSEQVRPSENSFAEESNS